ncbi:MAG: hypothetical protein ABFD84_13170 [Candidatus Polarisedimenticolia bacterium]
MPGSFWNDLAFTDDGDFFVNVDGDVAAVDDYGGMAQYEYLRQQVVSRLQAEANGWDDHPEICAGLGRFLGRTVDDSLVADVTQAVKEALYSDGLLDSSTSTFRVLQLDAHTLAVSVFVPIVSRTAIATLALDPGTGKTVLVD